MMSVVMTLVVVRMSDDVSGDDGVIGGDDGISSDVSNNLTFLTI